MSAEAYESRVLPWSEAAAGDVLDAVNRGRVAAGLDARSPELWRWRGESPGGAFVAEARHRGELRAVVCGVRHRVRLEDQDTTFLEVVDVVNDFDAGAGLHRAAAILEAGKCFAAELGGRVGDGSPLAYGIPNRRAHRLGLARLKTEILRSENVLVSVLGTFHPVTGDDPPVSRESLAGIDVEEVSSIPSAIDGVFPTFAEGRPAVGVRDAAWIDWRFLRHPEREYRVAVARRAGEIRGYAVLRQGEYAGHAGGILVDWIVPPGEPAASWELLVWASEVTRAAGGDRLVCNVPDKSPEWAGFQAVGFRVHGTDEYLVMRSFQKPYIMSWLFAHWFYTLGDSERG